MFWQEERKRQGTVEVQLQSAVEEREWEQVIC